MKTGESSRSRNWKAKKEREIIRAKGWEIAECDLNGTPMEAGYKNLCGETCVFTSVAYGISSFLFVRKDGKEKEAEERARSLAEKVCIGFADG